jgi:23S rRNA (pseudouridine1915-N3)-methyltransferase
MRIIIASVGKLATTSPAYRLFAEFVQRTPWEITLKEVEEKRPLPVAQLKEREAELLLKALPEQTFIIALDEKGKIPASTEFAGLLSRWQDEGHQTIAFLIGGANGHGPKVKERANYLLSLGPMTWPHMLVRVMLTEQIYRAHTILTGHPYHRA